MATSARIDTFGEKKKETPETPVVRRRSLGRTLAMVLFRACVTIIVLLFCAQVAWRYSGSNQWEKVIDENGIKVYTLKAPGADLLQLRANVRIHSTLAGIVAWMQDPDACKDSGCTESITIEKVSDQLEYNYFQFPYPAPFQKRDFVIRSLFYQNPLNKEVLLLVGAVADKIPNRDCCFRVNNMNNKWRFTPLDNGYIEVEMENNLDPGGFIPNVVFNSKRPRGMYSLLSKLQGWVGQGKYQSAKFDFIKEKGNDAPVSISQATPAP